MDADLAPERTEGFKVGEKKTLDEYAKLGMSYNTLHLVQDVYSLNIYIYNLTFALKTKKTRPLTSGRNLWAFWLATTFPIKTILEGASFSHWPWYAPYKPFSNSTPDHMPGS